MAKVSFSKLRSPAFPFLSSVQKDPHPAASPPSLRHCFEWSILPAGGERAAAGAGGGVCCSSQSRLVLAAEPHMFTGSIPPVEPQRGCSPPRTGVRSSRSWSPPRRPCLCVFKAFRKTDERKAKPVEIIRRISFHVVPPKSYFHV